MGLTEKTRTGSDFESQQGVARVLEEQHFAPQVQPVDSPYSTKKVNLNGGAIALGHSLAATGCVLLGKAVHELVRGAARITCTLIKLTKQGRGHASPEPRLARRFSQIKTAPLPWIP